jgi:hypothetical protein
MTAAAQRAIFRIVEGFRAGLFGDMGPQFGVRDAAAGGEARPPRSDAVFFY